MLNGSLNSFFHILEFFAERKLCCVLPVQGKGREESGDRPLVRAWLRGTVVHVPVSLQLSSEALCPRDCLQESGGGSWWPSGHPENRVILFDKLCGLSVLCVFAKFFLVKERQASMIC